MGPSKEVLKTQLLLLQIRNGHDSAVEELLNLWERPLFYFIRRLLPTEDDAWDTAQEVWITVIRSLHKLRTPEAFPAWLYQIARRTAYRHLKNNPVHASLSEEAEPVTFQNSVNPVDLETAQADTIHNALKHLKLEHREVLTLYFLEDFSIEAIAAITDTPAGTVKSRLHYAKKEMARILRKEDGDHA